MTARSGTRHADHMIPKILERPAAMIRLYGGAVQIPDGEFNDNFRHDGNDTYPFGAPSRAYDADLDATAGNVDTV